MNAKVLVCDFSVICNGTRDCTKCRWLKHLKIVDLSTLPANEDDKGGCACE